MLHYFHVLGVCLVLESGSCCRERHLNGGMALGNKTVTSNADAKLACGTVNKIHKPYDTFRHPVGTAAALWARQAHSPQRRHVKEDFPSEL